MTTRIARTAAFFAICVCCTFAAGERPPLSEKELEEDAALVVTGTVQSVERVVHKRVTKTEAGVEEYRLTVAVRAIHKGTVPPGPERPPRPTVVAVGMVYDLPEGNAGSGGHYSANSNHRISAVGEGWTLKLYLTPGKEGRHDLVVPNGFAVVEQPKGKEK